MRSVSPVALALLVGSALAASCSGSSTTLPDGGQPCSSDQDCPVGQSCLEGICQTPGGDEDVCSSDADCPAGFTCQQGRCRQQADGGSDGGDGGPAPDIEILAPPLTGDPPVYLLDFGSVMVGQTVSAAISIRNAGDADLHVVELAREMGTSDEFFLDQNLLDNLPLVLAPGEQTDIEVFYLAADGISDVGVISIISNDPDEARVPVQLVSSFKGTARLVAEPTTLEFGDIPVGASGELTLLLSNQGSGNAVLTIEAIQLASLVGDDFELGDLPSFPLYLNRGDAHSINVVFHPSTTGALGDRVVVASDDPSNPNLEVPLNGRGVEPSLSVIPAPVDLGEVAVGTSHAVDVEIRNDGGAPLTITGLELQDASSEFTMTSDPQTGFDLANISASNPQVLAPGEGRLLSIDYSPLDVGTDTATLAVSSPDIDSSPRLVAVQATGFVPPILAVEPAALDFGQVHVRGMATLELVLRNDGGRLLEFSSLQVSGINSFTFLPTAPPSLAAGEQTSLQVTFAPLTTGNHMAALQIQSNDPLNPQVDVSLSGESIDPNIFVWPPPPVDFGQVYRGTSNQRQVQVYTAGIGPLEVTRIELVPTGGDFSLLDVPQLPATITSSGQPLVFSIEYAPLVEGADMVALQIDSSDLDTPTLVINVTGEAVGCPAGWWDIDGDPANGCEYQCLVTNNGVEACDYIDNDCDAEVDEDFDLATDPAHCGLCNNDCVYNNATGLCVNSTCVLGPCDANFWDANNNPADGCEYACVQSNGGVEACDGQDNDCDNLFDEDFDLSSDVNNCGTCGVVCNLYQANPLCQAGTCIVESCQGNYANCDLVDVNGCEVDTLNDPDNCGSCGNICVFDNAPAICVNGACEQGDCSTGFLDCNGDSSDGCEVNAQSDEANCGACGQACDNGETCESGSCSCGSIGPDCQAGETCCGIDCVDVLNNDLHCGGCNQVCQTGEVCVSGTCSCSGTGPDCQPSEICCTGACFDPLSSNSNCGACGIACDAGELCSQGSCKCGGVGFDCTAPLSCCGTNCVDLSSDEQNCGTCGTLCALDNAVSQCQAGNCELVACNAGFADCNGVTGDGCETNTDNDLANCGACGNICSNDHGSTTCLLGNCLPTCSGLWANCDGDPDNGCETAINTLTDCGACGVACDLPNATDDCSSGTCSIASCDAGYADCNSQPGCETDILSDTGNCGSCGLTCTNSHGSTQCSAGVCDPTCSGLWGNCDGDPNDGCETPLDTLVNCGSCGQGCNLANADETCASGVCQIASCNSGFADCNGNDADGCEINIAADVSNCGACGNICSNAHGTTQCLGGTCVPSCDPLWGDCNGDPDDGCETALDTTSNCGGCGVTCDPAHATGDCSGGSCQIASCDAGFANCNGQLADGCEVDLASNLLNCGACGNACSNAHGTTQCLAGNCSPSCSGLWGDCDGEPDNGCETPTNTLTDCGTCSTACAPANASGDCSTGSCQIASCNAGFTDCNGLVSDGCETNTAADTSNCGACGNTCSNAHGTTQCVSGVCTPSCDSLWGDCNGDPDDGCETPLNTTTDCGSCGTACAPANASGECPTGSCAIASCSAGFADCNSFVGDGCEIDIAGSVSNCGGCGNICSNAHGTTQCVGGSCQPTCSGLWGDCDGNPDNGCETPLNTLTDCGSCGTVCDQPGGSETCATGTCEVSACDPGWADCTSAPGCETNTDNDIANCGTCGNGCSNAHGTTSCQSGNCTPVCSGLWGDCDGDPDNGCETAINTLSDCGGCGLACSLANASESCSTGSCVVTGCDTNYANCNGNDGDGCEVNLLTDGSNCGTCGNVCSNAHGTTSCQGGSCVPVCTGLWGDCDGDPDNGCETSLETLGNCGSCGTACSLANATETCTGGSCSIVACDANYGDCNGNPADGCEVNLLADLGNCGACGTTCSNDHGTTTCQNGTCTPSCTGLWGDCDGNPDNGCETPLNTLSDCGGCGSSCDLANASESCTTGTCQITTCNSGFADCNGLDGDGCEINTDSNTSNCGSCGTVCANAHGSTQCIGGTCVPSCTGLWGDCDGNPNNGCETSLATLSDCGSCGSTCSLANATETCATGTCLISGCNAGFADCNGVDGDGCEININTNGSNCGSCGNVCSNPHGTTSCSGGVCQPVCDPLWGNCDGDPDDGCETPLNTVTNCGGCGNACSLDHADESCATGTCLITSCNAGWDNCDSQDSNGCETYIAGDLNNCGACGQVCSLPHASEACSGGSCLITSCDSGYWDLNNLDSDGCECADTGDVAETCGTAGSVGTVSSGNTSIVRNGTIVHRTGYRQDVDCYRVSYSSPAPGNGTFRVRLVSNPANLLIQVWRGNCSTTVCGGDTTFTSTCSSSGPTCTSGNSNTFYVCVLPATGINNICQPYTIYFEYLATALAEPTAQPGEEDANGRAAYGWAWSWLAWLLGALAGL